jgi:hypothetical protein
MILKFCPDCKRNCEKNAEISAAGGTVFRRARAGTVHPAGGQSFPPGSRNYFGRRIASKLWTNVSKSDMIKVIFERALYRSGWRKLDIGGKDE